MTSFFWPLLGLFWFVASRFAAPRILPGSGELSALDALCRRAGVIFLGVCLLVWVIQLSAGSVEHAQFYLWPSPQKWLALATVLLTFLVAALWIFLGHGARSLAHAFGAGERKVKAMAGAFLLVVTVQNLVVFFT